MVVFNGRREAEVHKTRLLAFAAMGKKDVTAEWRKYVGKEYPEFKYDQGDFVKRSAEFFKQYENTVFKIKPIEGIKKEWRGSLRQNKSRRPR